MTPASAAGTQAACGGQGPSSQMRRQRVAMTQTALRGSVSRVLDAAAGTPRTAPAKTAGRVVTPADGAGIEGDAPGTTLGSHGAMQRGVETGSGWARSVGHTPVTVTISRYVLVTVHHACYKITDMNIQ